MQQRNTVCLEVKVISSYMNERAERVERVERVERLERVERAERVERVERLLGTAIIYNMQQR